VSFPLDLRVLGFTAAVTLLTGILFGIAPALRASTPDLAGILKSGGRGAAEAFAKTPLGAALVVGEVGLAIVALIGAGLFIRSAQNAQQLNPGFDAKNLFVFTFDLASRNYTNELARQFLRTVADRAGQVPGVESVAFSTSPPLSRGVLGTIIAEGQDADPNDLGTGTVFYSVTPGYFDTMKVRLHRGRLFTGFDRQDTKKVGVISEAMARFFWPGQDAVGKRFRFFRESFYREVVGIVGDSVTQAIGETPAPIAYLPIEQEFAPVVTLHVRTAVRPENLLRPVMSEVQRLDSNLALTGVSTADDLVFQGLWAPRVGAGLFSLFGVLGMLLASVGIYGVMAYMVAQRTNEIGIRMALGARPGDVIRLIVGQSMRLVGAGLAVGVFGALALTRYAKSLLFNLSPNDPLTFTAVAVIITAAALFAAWLPARRAARIDPLIALRQD
ncbi:MAG: FtsX-like permease family protein, partial [Bryobacteraceae bacterium]